jgi:aminoglycoside phosphotransferase (APT) family kinase protein
MEMKERLSAYLAGQGEVDGVRSISTGWETEVYAYDLSGAPKVLRIYQGRNVAVRAETEFKMLRYLGQMGYPVPQVDRFDADPALFGGPFLLMERVDGRPLVHLLREKPVGEVVEQLCRLMVRLHSLDWQGFIGPVWPDLQAARGSYDNRWAVRLLRDVDLLEPIQPLIDWLEEKGKGVAFRLAPLHGDFHWENVLVRPDGSPAVIDWGITGVGDPRCDLAYSYILMTTEGHPALAERVRQAYESMAGPQADWAYFETWALIRRLLVTLTVLVRGSAAMGLRPGLERFMRENIGYVRLVAGLVKERTGLKLEGIEALLEVESPSSR